MSCSTLPTETQFATLTSTSTSTSVSDSVTTISPSVTTIITSTCSIISGNDTSTDCSTFSEISTIDGGGVNTVQVTVFVPVQITETTATATLFTTECTSAIITSSSTTTSSTTTPVSSPSSDTSPASSAASGDSSAASSLATSSATPSPVQTTSLVESSSTLPGGSVIVTSYTSTFTVIPSNAVSGSNSGSSNNNAAIIGGVVGGVGGFAVLLLLLWLILRRRKSGHNDDDEDKIEPQHVTKLKNSQGLDLDSDPRPYQYGIIGALPQGEDHSSDSTQSPTIPGVPPASESALPMTSPWSVAEGAQNSRRMLQVVNSEGASPLVGDRKDPALFSRAPFGSNGESSHVRPGRSASLIVHQDGGRIPLIDSEPAEPAASGSDAADVSTEISPPAYAA